MGMVGWVPAAGGPSRIAFLLAMDALLPSSPLNPSAIWAAGPLLVLAVTSTTSRRDGGASPLRWPPRGHPAQLTAAVALALGIGIQNFPEGLPSPCLCARKGSAGPNPLDGGPCPASWSPFRPAHRPDGGQPPAADALAALLAAGAMLYVVVEELILGAHLEDHSPGRNSGGNGRVPCS